MSKHSVASPSISFNVRARGVPTSSSSPMKVTQHQREGTLAAHTQGGGLGIETSHLEIQRPCSARARGRRQRDQPGRDCLRPERLEERSVLTGDLQSVPGRDPDNARPPEPVVGNVVAVVADAVTVAATATVGENRVVDDARAWFSYDIRADRG